MPNAKFVVWSQRPSKSAIALARSLGTVVVRGTRPLKNNTVIINWGNKDWSAATQGYYRQTKHLMLNPVEFLFQNKVTQVRAFENNGIQIPKFYTNKADAERHLNENRNSVIVCRTLLNSHSGRGIVLSRTPDELVDAGLYTVHLRHKHEYRIHFAFGKIINVTVKKKRTGWQDLPEYCNLIRTYETGWNFCNSENTPTPVIDLVKQLIVTEKYDFGAVDVAYREKEDMPYVLEVNSAPGFEQDSATAEAYTNAFKSYLRSYERAMA